MVSKPYLIALCQSSPSFGNNRQGIGKWPHLVIADKDEAVGGPDAGCGTSSGIRDH
jgi:hypothetical protein